MRRPPLIMVAAALCLVVLAAVSSVVVGSAPSYQRLAKPRQPRSSLQQRGRGLLTRPTPNNAKRTKNRGGKKKQQIVSIELSTSGGITTREAQLFEPHPNTHSGYREGDVYCTLAFEKSPRLDADAVQQPAEFFLASFSVDNQTWDPTLNRSTRVFLSPEFNAMLLYRPGMKYHGGAQSRRVPWSFSVFASLEPDPGQSEDEKREQLMKMPRIQLLQTSTECLEAKFHDEESCGLWERCRLSLSATKELTQECGQHVPSPAPLALDLPQCASTLPPRFLASEKLAMKLDDQMGRKIGQECNWYLQRWMVPVPADKNNEYDTDAAIDLGKAVCFEYVARVDGRDWRPINLWMKLGLSRFMSASRQAPPAISLMSDLITHIDKYVGWNNNSEERTPPLVRWDILADSLALFAQSSDILRLQEALNIVERLRADPELEMPVGEASTYLLNLEAMLAIKVGNLALGAAAATEMFRMQPPERYADALVLAFMLINVKHYIMNPQKVFQNFLNPTLPNAEGMEALDQVLEEVEAFYQACLTRRVNNTPRLRHLALLGCVPLKVELHLIYLRVRASFLWRCFLHVCQASLDSCMMNYSRFTVPRASSQNYDGTPADGSAKPMKGSGKQEIPVSEWTPQRLDHMPTREELEGFVWRREPFIVSLPSRIASRSHIPSAKTLHESLSLNPDRRQQCRQNLDPYGWGATCDWTAASLCEVGGDFSVSLAVPCTGPDGTPSFAGSARPKRHATTFCDFVTAIDSWNWTQDNNENENVPSSHLLIDEDQPMNTQLHKCYFDAGSPRREQRDIRLFPLNRMPDEVPLPPFVQAADLKERFTSVTMWMGHSAIGMHDVVTQDYNNISLAEALRRPMPGKSGLHYDNLDNLHAVIRGRKRWRIMSPNDALKLDFIIPPDSVSEDGFLSAQPRPDAYKFYGFETRFSTFGTATEGVDPAFFPRPLTATQSVFFIDEGETL
eukprot:INCI7213.9.p1 GENE.INCI7213.9~~INCI7213.9.p1  ORF type:complete len:963 (-),score=120.06 INCI7213.9:430-3318(-)